jgi:hypothetical protein
MIDSVPLLLSIPAAGTRSVNIPLVNPAESQEFQVNVNYVGTGGTAATATITLTGTGGVGQNVTGNIGGVPFTYLGVVGDTTVTLAATNVVTYLKTIPGILGLVLPSSSAGVITATADIVGTASNSITVAAVGTGTLLAAVNNPTLTGGTNSTVSATTGVTASFLISYNNGVSYQASNTTSFTVPGIPLVTQTASRVYPQNMPQRVDGATVTNVLVSLTNLDATYAATVAVLVERTV